MTLSANRGARRPFHFFIVLPFVVYAWTAARTVGLPDSAILMTAMLKPVLSSNVCNHNLTNLAGYLFSFLPVSNLVFRLTLVSVLFGGLAIALFYELLYRLGASRRTAAGCAAVFMVSHSMWWHGATVENYALSECLLMVCCRLALRLGDVSPRSDRGQRPSRETLDRPARPDSPRGRGYASNVAGGGESPARLLAALFFVSGLALFNHIQNGAYSLAAGAVLVLILRRQQTGRGRLVFVCLMAWLLGVLPYATLLIHDLWVSPEPLTTLRWAMGGGFIQLMFRYDLVVGVRQLAGWILLQFPSPFLLALPFGLVLLFRATGFPSPLRIFLWMVLVVNLLFFNGYKTWDQFAFYLPVFSVLALAGSLAVLALQRRWAGKTLLTGFLHALLLAGILMPPWVYAHIGRWSRGKGYWAGRYGAITAFYRDRYDLTEYLVNPDKRRCDSLDRFVRLLLDRLPEGALLVDDASTYYQVEFLREQTGRRNDLELRLVRPPGMDGWGETPARIAHDIETSAAPVFFVTDAGPCASVLRYLERRNARLEVFPLAPGISIHRLQRASTWPSDRSR
ncbi:MAG: DUF2723 domain-containing protein [Lentisphaerae bacterium]|nr:DUF2723 domain-containing protein [Lentisphaerota bacterium]